MGPCFCRKHLTLLHGLLWCMGISLLLKLMACTAVSSVALCMLAHLQGLRREGTSYPAEKGKPSLITLLATKCLLIDTASVPILASTSAFSHLVNDLWENFHIYIIYMDFIYLDILRIISYLTNASVLPYHYWQICWVFLSSQNKDEFV